MSKNKNPLKDLDLFLKQQAASFVTPTPLSEKVKEETPAAPAPAATTASTPTADTEETSLLDQLEALARHDKQAVYDLLIQFAEKQPEADSAILINTALYLKSGDNWKDAVREYWKKR